MAIDVTRDHTRAKCTQVIIAKKKRVWESLTLKKSAQEVSSHAKLTSSQPR